MSANSPGPSQLGRSVVVRPDSSVPEGWGDSPRLVIDASIVEDVARLGATVAEMQRRYVRREPTVYELAVSAESVGGAATTDSEPYRLGAGFTFLTERLSKLLWHNSYDATGSEPIWWWSRKAERWVGARPGGPADVILADDTPVWLDGGPRQPIDAGGAGVVHHETLELGRATTVPPAAPPRSDLAPDQLAAVAHEVGPARVIAPAGSGKTRVLTARLRHLVEDRGVEPELVTAVAYNRRAADEMIERVPAALRSRIRTIHSLGWAILRMARPDLTLIDEREQRRRLEPIASAPPRANTDVIGPYLEALGEVRIGLQDPTDVETRRDDVPDFASTYQKYRRALAERGEADHDHQIYGAIEALLGDEVLRRHWQTQCRHLLVDEFQDLTPAYMLLLRLVSSPGLDVFGVGDDDQVIYGYAGADPGYLLDYESLFPGASTYALETNYRCPRDVVAGAGNVLGYNVRRLPKETRAHSNSDGLTIEEADGTEMGNLAVDRIGSLIASGVEPGQIAVLTRVNSSLLPVQVALAEKGIGFRSLLTPSVLDRTLLRAALAWVRIALDPESMTRNDLFQAIRRPGRGLTRLFTSSIGGRRGPFGVEAVRALGEDLDGKRQSRWDAFCDDIELVASTAATTSELLDTLAGDVGLSRAAAALDAGRSQADRSGQGDDLVALQRIAGLHQDPGTFEPWLRERLATPSVPEGVVLSTVHRVKGLEWDHVIVFGADASQMPHHLSSDVEEERRVFHVAMTRGIESVAILADAAAPSPFLAEVDGSRPRDETVGGPATPSERARVLTGVTTTVGDEIKVRGGYRGMVIDLTPEGCLVRLDGGGAEVRVRWGDRIEVGGRIGPLIRDSSEVDESLLDRLKRWRLDQSSSQGVPAYVIFHDRTLDELAAVRPTSQEGLLAISGIGPAKLEAYGEDLLDLLAE